VNDLIIATLWELAEKVQAQNYVKSVLKIDEQIVVEYHNGFKHKISLPVLQTKFETLDTAAIIDELKIVINNIIDLRFKEVSSNITDIIAQFPLPQDGKDADEEAIITKLKSFLEGSLKEEISLIFKSLPLPQDGKDGEVDYSKIEIIIRDLFQEYKEKLDLIVESAISNIVIPQGKDGQDGRDADEEKIIEVLRQTLDVLVKAEVLVIEDMLRTILDNLVLDQIELLKKDVATFIDKKFGQIVIPEGRDGKDGRDADEEAIKNQVLADVELILQQKTLSSYERLRELVISLVQSIKLPKGDKGDKGEQGSAGQDGKSIKGDRGNGIRDAKIDGSGYLIIKTDDRDIEAGKVAINNFYGGGGGGGSESISYTNSKPMPFKLGGLPKGTRFKNTNFKTLMTKLLYGVELPYFSTFSIQKQGGAEFIKTIEIGYSLISETLSAAYSIENDLLLEADSITLLQGNEVVVEKVSGSPFEFQSLDVTYNVPQNVDFTLLAYDTTGTSFQSVITLGFKYKIYYGEYTDDIMDWVEDNNTNPLSILRAKELTLDIYGEYYFQGVGYKWFCYPESLGENYVFYEISSDIALVFDEVRKITITNEYGLSIKYNCYRTLNEIHEEFVMGIKNG